MTNWTHDSWSQNTNTGYDYWRHGWQQTPKEDNKWTNNQDEATSSWNPTPWSQQLWNIPNPPPPVHPKKEGKGHEDEGHYTSHGGAKGKGQGDDPGIAKGEKGKAYPNQGSPGLAKGTEKGQRERWTCTSCNKTNSSGFDGNGPWSNACHCTAEAQAKGKAKSSTKNDHADKGYSKSKGKGKTIDEIGNAHRNIPDAKGNLVYTRVWHAKVEHASGRPKFDREVKPYLVGDESDREKAMHNRCVMCKHIANNKTCKMGTQDSHKCAWSHNSTEMNEAREEYISFMEPINARINAQ